MLVNITPLYLSIILAGCCLISCAAPGPGGNQQGVLLQTERQFAGLKRAYGEISLVGLEPFFRYLLARLADSEELAGRPLKISLLDSSELFAVSFPRGEVVLSKGLFLAMSGEGELAFVVAHELGHIFLDHFSNGIRDRKEREHQADIFALSLLWKGGYDPRVASSTLMRSYVHFTTAGEQSSTHPDITSRQLAIKEEIRKLKIPAIRSIESRGFLEIRHRLGKGEYRVKK